jgi:hypothetical protein
MVCLLPLSLVVAVGRRTTHPNSAAHVASNLHLFSILDTRKVCFNILKHTFPEKPGRLFIAGIQEGRSGGRGTAGDIVPGLPWSQERRNLMNLGNRLQEVRRAHTLTTHQSAMWTKVSTGFLCQLERCCHGLFLQQLQRIATVLRVPWKSLLGEDNLQPQVVRTRTAYDPPQSDLRRFIPMSLRPSLRIACATRTR